MILWQYADWRITSEHERTFLYRNQTRWEIWQRPDGSWFFPAITPAYVQATWTTRNA